MVCTCGLIKRPLGACSSCGITSRTVSPASQKPSVRSCSCCEVRRRSAARNSSKPSPVRELMQIGFKPHRFSIFAATASGSAIRSHCERTATTAIFCPRISFSHSISTSGSSSVKSKTAISVRSSILRLRATRSRPNAESSSIPAVSIITHAPTPVISIAFTTGSVVVPTLSDTMATSCPVRAFTSDDLPLLHRPKMAILVRSEWGVEFIVKEY